MPQFASRPTSSSMALRYGAYLVRVWQDSPHTPWRASAQSVQSGEKLLFADIEQLFVFLRTQCYPEGHQPPVDPPGSV